MIEFLFSLKRLIRLLPSALRHFTSLLGVLRLYFYPRFKLGRSRLLKEGVFFVDAMSFLFMYEEIFERGIYNFHASNENPLIMDCGANIGLSVIYFKKLYPNAHIVAFEPDKDIFAILKKNVERHGLSNVTLINKAVSEKTEKLVFSPDFSDGGRVSEHSVAGNGYEVEAITLSSYIKERDIDFLKIDIEGSEGGVLKEIEGRLGRVKALFVEYHSFPSRRQELGEMLDILSRAGFRYYIDRAGAQSRTPFLSREESNGMDLQLNIFCYR